MASRGFTLVEVLVTMALMAAILPVAMRGISIAITTAAASRHRVEAATLGQAKLTEIVALSTIQLDSSQLGSSGDFGEAYPTYTWSSRIVDDPTVGVTHVTLTVNWLERGTQQALDLSTMVQTPTQ
jgi:prepilin-type N-terminal cleavage/methylation domain-containing protein